MITYMPLNGHRWSRDSGSALCDTPQSAVLGRPGGEVMCSPPPCLLLADGCALFIGKTEAEREGRILRVTRLVFQLVSYCFHG